MTDADQLDPTLARNIAELRRDVVHGIGADGTFATVRIPALDNVLTLLDFTLADRAQSIALNAQLAKTVDLNAAIAEEANEENDQLRARVAEFEAERARIVECIRINRDDYPEKSKTWFAVDDVLALIRAIEAERTTVSDATTEAAADDAD